MGKGRSLEAKLARLKLLSHEPQSPDAVRELRAALGDASNLLVAEAAQAVTEANGKELRADLLAAFDRFLINPLKTDKLCRAKAAIAEALNRIEYNQVDFFRQNVHYVQLEPVWGGQQDAAGPLRAACAFAIVRLDHSGALPVLADLLADSEKPVRMAAAQALVNCMPIAAIPLLRLKARLGDKEPEVVAECFAALLQLNAASAVPFVAEFLDAPDDAICTSAALALGESRRPDAFEHLAKYWNQRGSSRLPNEVTLAMALLRLPTATEFLLRLVADTPASAAAAVAALAVLRHDSQLRPRVADAVSRTGSATLKRLFEEKFRV